MRYGRATRIIGGSAHASALELDTAELDGLAKKSKRFAKNNYSKQADE
jgi:hypothetical protein